MSELNKRIANLSPAKRAFLDQRLNALGNKSIAPNQEWPELEKAIARLIEAGQGENVPPPIRAISREEPLTLSFAQQRLWFLDRLEEGQSVAYQVPRAIRLEGDLQVDALERAFNEIVRRHEVLRTIFGPGEEGPLQFIVPESQTSLGLIDLVGCPEGEREAELRRRLRGEIYEPFDLARGPLLRTRLYRLGEQEHVLLLNMHHIVTDGWSMGVLFRELSLLYAAFCKGQPSPLPELAIQYADYARWQRNWLQGVALERQLEYWKEQLAGAPARLELPTDRPRPPVQTFRGGKVAFIIPKEVAAGLKGVGRRAGATPFMTLYGAFAVLLSRWSGQEDLVIGSPIAGRRHVALETLIGFLVNTLALRADLSGDPSFWELLGRIKTMTLEAYAHQDLPFEQLVEELQPTRSLSYTPLFQVMLVMQNAPVVAIDLGELKATPVESGYAAAKFDLTLGLQEVEEGLRGSFNYNADLFDEETIGRMADQFQLLLEGIVAEPEGRISKLALLRGAERHRILVEWNQTAVDYPKARCVHELVEEQAEHTPEAVAAVFESTQLTYRKLNDRANQLAHHLQELGVGPDTLVGICLERSLDMVVGLLGILKAGGAYVPLDPGYPKERLTFMVRDSGAAVLLTQQGLRDQLQVQNPNCQILCLDAEWGMIARCPTRNPISGVSPENLAYVIYTSGSTGRPKGVEIEHRALTNFLCSMAQEPGLSETDVVLAVTILAFDIAGLELFLPLITGARIELASRKTAQDGAALARTLSSSGATTMQATPATWRLLFESGWKGDRRLRVLCGGEAMDRDLAARLVSTCGSVWNMYGPTETTIWSSVARIESDEVTIGRPIANTQMYVLDGTREPVPPGVTGELHIGGVQLARGYLGRPELTAEKFVQNPFGEGRLYKTGDLARYRSDGVIEFLGRIDNQVKIRGFRIELGEIETVLGQHPSVQESIVIAREDIPGGKRLVAYVVARDHTPGDERLSRHAVSGNGATSPSELREFLQVKLPDYMVPAAFVPLETLPLTPNGKVDRKALPKPDLEAVADESKFVAPSTPTQIVLARIWSKVLGLQEVGIHDNFFELGGHSLLALRIFSEIEKELGDRLPLATLFQAPTIEKLATVLDDRNWKATLSPLVAIQPSGLRPPFFGVHSVDGEAIYYSELARYLGKDQPFYAFQGLELCLKGDTSIEAIASYYLQEIRQVQAHGPFLLGGYCIGGVIAFEMAQQFRAAGEEVALLVLFDAQNPDRPARLLPIGKRIRFALEGLPPSAKRRYIARRIAGELKRKAGDMQKAGSNLLQLLHKARKLEGDDADGGLLPVPLSVPDTLYRATAKYKPRAYPGRIVLFRPITLTPDPHYERADDLGWTEVAEGGLEIHYIPGIHTTMFERPHVQVGAEKLAACIQAALSR
jgi:amino acid adenylation domain-containing protein